MRKVKTASQAMYVRGANLERAYFWMESFGSPRVNGKLRLVSNPVSIERANNVSYKLFGNSEYALLVPGLGVNRGTNTPASQAARSEAYNKAYSAFRGKLYKGGASLGVTIGSYKQSREMIVTRAKTLEKSIALFSARIEKNQIKRQSLASTYLEAIFGWKPLLSDMHAAATTVIQQAEVSAAVGGKGSSYFEETFGSTLNSYSRSGTVKCHVGSLVSIANPNVWLAERAGLLNPATVLWDLVPWSFVVNMFVNTAQLINSISDFAGLSFQNESVTTTTHESNAHQGQNGYPSDHPFWGGSASVSTAKVKDRRVGVIPKPSFQFKLPDANWELAAIAASLVVQRVAVLNRLFSVKFP